MSDSTTIPISEEQLNAALEQANTEEPVQTANAPVARPDVQSQSPQTKQRGRKAYPRTEDGRIIRPDGSIGPKTRSGNSVRNAGAVDSKQAWTDEECGKVIQGAFMCASIPLGGHWRLFPQEMQQMGECFGPLFRRYPEMVPEWLKLLVVAPTVVGIVGPRLAIQQMQFRKEIPKGQERLMLLKVLSLMEAEKHLDIAKTVNEHKEFLESQVTGAAVAAKMMAVDPQLAEQLQAVKKSAA